jgi:hypothetical protein
MVACGCATLWKAPRGPLAGVELLTPLRGRQQGHTTAVLLARDGSIDWLWPRCVPSRPCSAMRIKENLGLLCTGQDGDRRKTRALFELIEKAVPQLISYRELVAFTAEWAARSRLPPNHRR